MKLGKLLNHCGLMEIDFKGLRFTWHNKQQGNAQIMIRLDRALAFVEWNMEFQNAVVIHQRFRASDHKLIMVQL